MERTGPKTVVSSTVVQFHRWLRNCHWHSPIPANHVSRVTILPRVTCCSPANAFQPPLTILSSMTRVDWATGVAPYEFYREKAWQESHVYQNIMSRVYYITCQTSHALAHLAEETRFTKSGYVLARKLR